LFLVCFCSGGSCATTVLFVLLLLLAFSVCCCLLMLDTIPVLMPIPACFTQLDFPRSLVSCLSVWNSLCSCVLPLHLSLYMFCFVSISANYVFVHESCSSLTRDRSLLVLPSRVASPLFVSPQRVCFFVLRLAARM